MDLFDGEEDFFDDVDIAAIIEAEERAARRNAAIEAGRRRGGAAGAAVAGIMLVLSDIYEPNERDEVAIVVEAGGEPGDIDADGIDLHVDGLDIWSPPPDEH